MSSVEKHRKRFDELQGRRESIRADVRSGERGAYTKENAGGNAVRDYLLALLSWRS
jgi:hypothetical protein